MKKWASKIKKILTKIKLKEGTDKIMLDFLDNIDIDEARISSDNYILGYNEEHNTAVFTPTKKRGETGNLVYMGCELETECHNGDNVYNTIAPYVTRQLLKDCYIAQDGSLTNGMEIISQPYTIKKWQELEPNIDALFTYLQNEGFTSHDNEHCGFHIHVTRPSEDAINRILFIMEFYKNELVAFSRRNRSKLLQWAPFMSDVLVNENNLSKRLQTMDFIKDKKENMSCHSRALNLSHSRTIEFRIFRGTLNKQTFFATLELVNNLVTMASDENIPLSKITWKKLTSTPNAKAYCEIRNIHTDRTPRDISSDILREMRLINKMKVRAYRVLVETINAINEPVEIKKPIVKQSVDKYVIQASNYSKELYKLFDERHMIIYELSHTIKKLDTINDYEQFKSTLRNLYEYQIANDIINKYEPLKNCMTKLKQIANGGEC